MSCMEPHGIWQSRRGASTWHSLIHHQYLHGISSTMNCKSFRYTIQLASSLRYLTRSAMKVLGWLFLSPRASWLYGTLRKANPRYLLRPLIPNRVLLHWRFPAITLELYGEKGFKVTALY